MALLPAAKAECREESPGCGLIGLGAGFNGRRRV
jgi:hypothetical protein